MPRLTVKRSQKPDPYWPDPTPTPRPLEPGRFRVVENFACRGHIFLEGSYVTGELALAIFADFPEYLQPASIVYATK